MNARIVSILISGLAIAPLAMADEGYAPITASGNGDYSDMTRWGGVPYYCDTPASSVSVERNTDGDVYYSWWVPECASGYAGHFDAYECTGDLGEVLHCHGTVTLVGADCDGFADLWLGVDGEFHFRQEVLAESCDGTLWTYVYIDSNPNFARVG